ncbi:armadillo repeat-containing protein 1-like isoform X2 [Physella acuta]|nr:armadillo repeat-containing protein 1-like isoform X2 [Physella acuta]XP_059151846.1 armadillo repeat-containing protein 1-like isoform X2 [Physella acuta]XP_059151847.1 armadillo repeat-containing protein 1-like isoform X2 [Physella acuta]XP_059151848.1 armadillo repeat-containing protein 1-like isoform X2 [Physella acuta]
MVTADAVAAMKTMALDPRRRTLLAKDATCIGGLVIVLSNMNQSIVEEALQTLLLLSECQEACTILKNHVGMLDQLNVVIDSCEKNSRVYHLAQLLLEKFNEISLQKTKSKPLADSTNNARSSSNEKNTSLNGHNKAKSIILQIKGLHDKSDRDVCARLLLKVRGVISITFDLSKKRCILRTKADIKPEMLASIIAKSMTMTAQQVVRNDKGEESLVSFNTSTHQAVPEQEDLPDYLSDDSDTTIIDDKAVKKPTEEDKKKSAGWFSKAANFLSSSFYW